MTEVSTVLTSLTLETDASTSAITLPCRKVMLFIDSMLNPVWLNSMLTIDVTRAENCPVDALLMLRRAGFHGISKRRETVTVSTGMH